MLLSPLPRKSRCECHTQKHKLLHELKAATTLISVWHPINKQWGPLLAAPPEVQGHLGVLRGAVGFSLHTTSWHEQEGSRMLRVHLRSLCQTALPPAVSRLPQWAPWLAGLVHVLLLRSIPITSILLGYKIKVPRKFPLVLSDW